MRCLFCCQEYHYIDLVFTTPALCPLCILGHGNVLYHVSNEFKSVDSLRKAVDIMRKPTMIHRLRCQAPCR
jgi:hypothetical protein